MYIRLLGSCAQYTSTYWNAFSFILEKYSRIPGLLAKDNAKVINDCNAAWKH